MDIKYEYLEMIPEIKEMMINASSPYLSRKELANYIKVSESFIKQRLYNGEFQENIHYFKIGDAKILFVRVEVDKWVKARKEDNGKPLRKEREALSEYLSQWKENHSSNGA